jgi:hypothetical protein
MLPYVPVKPHNTDMLMVLSQNIFFSSLFFMDCD